MVGPVYDEPPHCPYCATVAPEVGVAITADVVEAASPVADEAGADEGTGVLLLPLQLNTEGPGIV